MDRLLRLLMIFSLSVLFFSCEENPPIHTDTENTVPGDTEESEDEETPSDPIDEKYPNWKVGISGFGFSPQSPKGTTFTIKEKKFLIKYLALTRSILNTQEFLDAWEKNKDSIDCASETDSYPGSPYSISTGQEYDKDRLLETILNADFDVLYRKHNLESNIASANVGKSLYVRQGYDPDVYDTEYLCNLWSGDLTQTPQGYVSYLSLIFHENLHNAGMEHHSGYDAVSKIQMILFNVLVGNPNNIEGRYAEQTAEIENSYLEKYAHLLTDDVNMP